MFFLVANSKYRQNQRIFLKSRYNKKSSDDEFVYMNMVMKERDVTRERQRERRVRGEKRERERERK